MVVFQIFGSVESSTLVDDGQEMVLRLTAFSERVARNRANQNARIKGMENTEVTEVELVGSGTLPGQKVFLVTVVGDR